MNAPRIRRPCRLRQVRPTRRARRAGAALLMTIAIALLAAACGSDSESSSKAGGANALPTAIQVMATAERGDLTESVTGTGEVTKSGGGVVVVATVAAEDAGSVAAGQDATVSFMSDRGDGSGQPQPGASGMPEPQGSGMPWPDASGMPQGQGGQGDFPGGGGGDRGGVSGAVESVEIAADGSATVTITVDEDDLPDEVTTGTAGFARIATKVLVNDVILIPTAAIEGSGDDATVQVMSGGKAETRGITVGQQSGGRSEVTSGLNEGESVVYVQAFEGSRGGRQSGMPFPQQSGGAQ